MLGTKLKNKLITLISVFLCIVLAVFLIRTYGDRRQESKDGDQENTSQPIVDPAMSSEFPLENEFCDSFLNPNCEKRIQYLQVDNQGNVLEGGANKVIVFDPTSSGLDFKVNVPLVNQIGEEEPEYTAKNFKTIVSDQNSLLENKKPFAGINADYIDEFNKPQGLNSVRGRDYSGQFASLRSSFGISGGEFARRQASIQIGRRETELENYHIAGGNGRFYQNGEFKDICEALGTVACRISTNRSMAVITSSGYVIFLVHQSSLGSPLLPDQFDDVLEPITKAYDLGAPVEGILFDGGSSPGIMYDGRVVTQTGGGPIGSVFLIYID